MQADDKKPIRVSGDPLYEYYMMFCALQRQFETQEDAEVFAQMQTTKYNAYLCESCRKWHLTEHEVENQQ